MRTRFIVPTLVVLALVGVWAFFGPRPAGAQENTVEYTVVPGDTCWDIAERFGYDGSLFDTVVYYPNSEGIESNVQRYGWADSDFCHWIHPGLHLLISSNTGEPPRVVGTGDPSEPRSGGNTFVFAPTNVKVNDDDSQFDNDWWPWLLLGLLALLLLGAVAALAGQDGFGGHHHHDAPPAPPPTGGPTPVPPPIVHVIPFVIGMPDFVFIFEDDEDTESEEGKGSKDEPSEDPVT